jgi:predicted lipid-binding transport protein (Tim44 family)
LPNNDSFDPSIIVFAALAIFVVWKLWSILGVRTDRESPAPDKFRAFRRPGSFGMAPAPGAALAPQPATPAPEPSVDRWKDVAEPGGKIWAGLDAIAAADPSFSAGPFLQGARKAYEIIVVAFAKGDRDTLYNLLSKDVYESFSHEIDAREKRGERAEVAVVSIDEATIQDAQADARSNRLTVRFVSKLLSTRRDKAGEIIEGSPDVAATIIDLWTFARNPALRDPNWKLVATETGH